MDGDALKFRSWLFWLLQIPNMLTVLSNIDHVFRNFFVV